MKKFSFMIIVLIAICNLMSEVKFAAIPFAYYSAEFSMSVGAYAAADNIWQEGTHVKVGGLTSSNNTHFFFYQMREFMIPFTKRMFFEPNIYVGKFGEIRVYHNPNSTLAYDKQPGHNDSDGDDFFEVKGEDIWVQMKTRYLLPIGDGKDYVKPFTKLEDGRVVESKNGGTSYNPFKSGRTKIDMNPFYRKQEDIINNGIEIIAVHDNFDWEYNPTKGNKTKVTWIKDFGKFGSDVDWENWEIEHSEYFQLNDSWKYPLVLALNGWTSHCPTWNLKNDDGLYKRPASFAGAQLGGKNRFRAYYEGRFNDRSAICYIAEVRQVFKNNPLKDNKVLRKFGLDVKWMQMAYFIEMGRVADDWNAENLHKDMKGDFGVGLRINADKFLLRLDYAYGNDGSLVQMFIDQPF
jgi:hypothetical protein